MNTILLQKILDILTEGLAHVGDFFKDLFVSDPQDGQVIGYDADAGKWKNMSIAELSLDVTDTAGPDDIITFSDAADMPLKSLVANIDVEGGTDNITVIKSGVNFSKPYTFTYSGSGMDIAYDNNSVTLSGTAAANVNVPVSSWVRDNDAFITLPAGTYTATISQEIQGISIQAVNATNGGGLGSNAKSVTFTLNQTTNVYLRVVVASGTEIAEGTTIGISLTSGSDTTYYSYTGTVDTILLPSSVANGYVDIISGSGMNMDTSTPFTVTPVVIHSNTGVNNIYANTGPVKAEYYTKTAGDIKNLVSITEDITSDITKNTTDFSDILLKVSQNNKVVSIEIYNATTAEAVNETFLSDLPKPAMNVPVMFINNTLGEDGIFYGSLTTSGSLRISVPGAKSFGGLITYVAK